VAARTTGAPRTIHRAHTTTAGPASTTLPAGKAGATERGRGSAVTAVTPYTTTAADTRRTRRTVQPEQSGGPRPTTHTGGPALTTITPIAADRGIKDTAATGAPATTGTAVTTGTAGPRHAQQSATGTADTTAPADPPSDSADTTHTTDTTVA